MLKDKQTKDSVSTKNSEERSTFWEWLVYGKGTVSEPWPTINEVLKDENVQKEIKKVQDAVQDTKK